MFFSFSKIFWLFFQPLTFLSVMIFSGLLFLRWKAGRALLYSSSALLLICGFFPVGPNLLCYLESVYPLPRTLPKDIDGIIVLGGAVEADITAAREQVQINDRGERLTEFVKLARLYPEARLVFSGGDVAPGRASGLEAKYTETLFRNLGLDVSRIYFENESRNTYENYLYTARHVLPRDGQKWVLVTSAFHLPRSVAIFQSNGWVVIPYPAGFLTDGDYKIAPTLEVLENFTALQVAVKEIIGIMAYTLTGRIR